ncbi:polysaccharide biosynthesis protein, partial [Candidatus Sumerlaeota bacterium]|nr:polysaccharide biosynthesis protein [Candidatus Sumerlaeota bacterium]
EKLTEDLLTQEEGTTATEHGKIFIARRETRSWDDLEVSLNRLFRAAGENDEATIRSIFKELIPDFA